MVRVYVEVVRRDDTPGGVWNGRAVFHVQETFPLSYLFQGCPLGRGTTKDAALWDFVRRARGDDPTLELSVFDLQVTRTKDIASPAESYKRARCNCENDRCHQLHPPGGCLKDPAEDAPFGVPKALYVGEVCFSCAQRLPKEYVLPPYGTAHRNPGD